MSDRGEFAVKDGTWLVSRIHEGKVNVSSLCDALKIECVWKEGQGISKDILDKELQVINEVPQHISCIRCDKIERLSAEESHRSQQKSVDICCQISDEMLLVECKYRAIPETCIVKTIKAFNSKIVEKFENSSSFLTNFLNKPFSDDRVVLFNHESIDKVLNMFRRLRLEHDEVHQLANYVIVDTAGFLEHYSLNHTR